MYKLFLGYTMKLNKKAFIMVFLAVSLLCNFINMTYAIDEYGNQLTDISIRQYISGKTQTIETITNSTYVENANYSLINGFSPLSIYVGGLLNKTEWGYGDIVNTLAFGIQVFGNTSYEAPLAHVLPAYPLGDFWVVDAVTEIIEIEYDETNVCNVTVWLDYDNGSGWLEIEEYVFNLTYEFYENPTPPIEGEINFDIIYFWLFVITLFSTTINTMLIFRLGETSYAFYAFLSFAFCITFLITLIS